MKLYDENKINQEEGTKKKIFFFNSFIFTTVHYGLSKKIIEEKEKI